MIERYFDLYFFKSLFNTNDKVKEILKLQNKNKNKNIALFSVKQEKGKGRKNREWISKEGDLTCSFAIQKKLNVNDLGKINLFTIYSLINAFNKIGVDKNISYKWPNDILINKKKIAGVLIETNVSNSSINQCVIGIGVNFISKVIHSKFSSISINDLTINYNALNFFFLLIECFDSFFENYSRIEFEKISRSLSTIFFDKKKNITINLGDHKIDGFFKKINSSGELLIQKHDEEVKINYGEII